MKKTFEELKSMKFDVVEHFGMLKKGEFFIMNTIPPMEYGCDCQDYEWLEVDVKTDADLDALKMFIEDIFAMNIFANNIKDAVNEINGLDAYLASVTPAIDYGACHVVHLPIKDKYKKTSIEC